MVNGTGPLQGFSLVELLIVISIIGVLAGLMIVGLNALGIGSKRAKTATILETVRQGLELSASEQGGYPSPAEHPLAGSLGTAAAPRAVFRRDAAQGGETVDATSDALSGVELGNLSGAARARLLLRSDRFADQRMPLLYGMPREALGVLGSPQVAITRHRRLTRQATPTTIITDPDDLVRFPDVRCLVVGSGGPEGNKRAIDYVFGKGGSKGELARLGALDLPDEAKGEAIAYGRAWSDESAIPEAGETAWKPGSMRDPQAEVFTQGPDAGKPRWITYRLRGLAVYDAWQREILYSQSLGGVTRLISAGADGVFRWHPGQDEALESSVEVLAGDDRDGSLDNVQVAIGGDVK